VAADVIVVGAGFAGLSAACAIAARGRRVLVLEARPTIGGRATAFTDPATGERVDNGQHVLIGCYDETFRFLRRIGAEANVMLQRDLSVDFVDRDGRASRLSCPRLPPPFHLLGGVIKWDALTWRDRVTVLRLGAALRGVRLPADLRSAGGGRDDTTVRDWLRAQGQTPRVIELLWEPLAVAALNQSIDTAAAEPFVEVLRRMFTGSSRNAALGLPLKPLDEMYAVPAREFIERHGGEVRVNSPARIHGPQGVARQSPVETSPELSVEVRGGALRSVAVICAVPWFALGDTVVDPSPALRRTIADASTTAASPIVTVNLWFDRIVTANTFVGLPGRTMQWVFDKRLLFGEQTSHLSLVSSGAEAVVAMNNQALSELAVSEVRAALPLARDAVVTRAVVVREKRATFSVAPGQPARPATVTDVPGLFLAGDWIDTGLPATIESAVVSGHRAADAAHKYIEDF
jgi:zeta-carotene desaturase